MEEKNATERRRAQRILDDEAHRRYLRALSEVKQQKIAENNEKARREWAKKSKVRQKKHSEVRAKYFENMKRLDKEAASEQERQMRVMSESSKKKSALES